MEHGLTGTCLLFLIILVLCGGARAESSEPAAFETLTIPFPFYNESFGVGAGLVYGRFGWPERQARVLASATAGTEGAGLLFLAGQDLRTPWLNRLFVDPILSVGYFDEIKSYINGNPEFQGENAGSNASSENNFVVGDGHDNFLRIRFRYLLPLGDGKDQVVPRYEIVDGLPVAGFTGALSLNPLESGRTFLDLRPFYRSQEINGDAISADVSTNGIDFGLTWDNRDFPANPSRGQGVSLRLSRDFGAFDSDDSWTVLQAEVDQYIDLGRTDRIRKAVLALDAWTAETPSWENRADGSVAHRPPAYAGATLGGLWRMRAYPAQRFNDRAAIYYAAELRVIPEWNPFDAWPAFRNYADVEWLQFVPFVEFGRVAPRWSLSELHSDMKWNVGFGIRAWASGFVVRADTAFSDEGGQVQMIISQPFQTY